MTRKSSSSRKPSQRRMASTSPTAPQPRCPKTGHLLDEFGLPISGPARAAELKRLGKPDPREDPRAWRPLAVSDLPTTEPAAPVEGEA